MGRRDNYRFELLAHPGWSRRAARYDDGLLAHSDSRPAHTETSPGRRPGPENENLPSPGPPAQTPPTTHRHTRYNGANLVTAIAYKSGVANYFYYDSQMQRYAIEDSAGLRYFTWDRNGMNLLCERDAEGNVTAEYAHGYSAIEV